MIKAFVKYKWLYHAAYWILALFFLTFFFGRFNRSTYYTFLFTAYQLPIVIATTYTINYWLIPKFLFLKRYWHFIYFLIGTILLSVWMNALIVVFAIIKTYKFDVGAMPPASFDLFFLTAGLYLIILFGVVIHLVKETFKQQEERYRIQEQQIETELKLKESKLKLLQGQLHPHMLFNSLNTIYGHSLQKSEKAPDLIINLSNLLDYMLYHCDVERIPLEKEIEFLKDFIELEKHKFPETLNLDVSFPENAEHYNIAPLILLPFCENCFKHAKHTVATKPNISIKLRVFENQLRFETSNTYDSKAQKSKKSGVGIQNVKERLKLIYPDKHELQNQQDQNQYNVFLRLKLDTINNES